MNDKNVPETIHAANGTGGVSTGGKELDDLLDMVMAQCRAGRLVDLEELVSAHPQLESELRQAVPALIALELSDAVTIDPHTFGAPREVLQGNRTLGDFKLLREVGRGGMGVVYEAEQISLGRRVALKVLPMAGLLDDRQLQRFKNEARAAASLHHPNIVPVYSVGTENAVHFYAMQLIDGQTLADFIRQMEPAELENEPRVNRSSALERLQGSLATQLGPRRSASREDQPSTVDGPQRERAEDDRGQDKYADVDRATTDTVEMAGAITQGSLRSSGYFRLIAELGIQVAEALEYAHSLGIVHRDIKPSNLLLDSSGKVWVADFGLAHIEADAGMTMTGDLLGTLRYMSPEQTLGQRGIVDGRADIYSLGISLYELLTARPAFQTASRQQLLRQLIEQEPVKPRQLNSAIPKDLETIVLKAIAKDPQQRYATAQELADDLRRLLNHQPVRAKRPSTTEVVSKWARRHTGAALAIAAVLLVVTMASGISTVMIADAYDRESWQRRAAEEAAAREHAQAVLANQQAEKARSNYEFAREAIAQELLARQEADQQRRLAEQNLAKAREAVDRVVTRFADPNLLMLPGIENVRAELLHEALVFYRGFLKQQSDDPQLRYEAASAWARVGKINEVFNRHKASCEAWHEAIMISEQLVNEFPSNRQYHVMLATLCRDLGGYYVWRMFDYVNAELQLLRTLDICDNLMNADSIDQQVVNLYCRSQLDLAVVYRETGRRQQSEDLLLDAIHSLNQLSQKNRLNAFGTTILLDCEANLAHQMGDRDPEASDSLFRSALAKAESAFEENPHYDARERLAATYHLRGRFLRCQSRFAEAEADLRRGLELMEPVAKVGFERFVTKSYFERLRIELAQVLLDDSRPEEAREIALKLLDVIPDPSDGWLAVACEYNLLGQLEWAAEARARAAALSAEVR